MGNRNGRSRGGGKGSEGNEVRGGMLVEDYGIE